MTANVSSSNHGVNTTNPNSNGEGDDLELYKITYDFVWGDNEVGKDVGGYHRHRADTIHKILHYFNPKTNRMIIKSEIYKPARYRN